MRVAATAVTITIAALAVPATAFANASPVPARAPSVAHIAGTTGAGTTSTPSTLPTLPTTPTTSTTSPTSTTGSPTPTPSRTLRLAPRRPLDLASGRAALTAYAAYLGALVKAVPAAQATVTALIASASSGCRSALAPLMQGSEQLKPGTQSTLTALGVELGDDLALSFDTAALTPLTTMSQTLEHLRWTRGARNAQIIRRYVGAQLTAMQLTPSNLCQDALLAATNPRVTPYPTRAFLKRYAYAAGEANARTADFMQLLQAYVTSSEQRLVTRIQSLTAQLTRLERAEQTASAQTLSSTLEAS